MEYRLKYANLAPKVWQKLDEIERTGWVMRDVKEPETVQKHTLELIRLAEEIPGLEEYRNDGLREILEVHDWAEAIVGDEVILVWDDEEKKQKLKASKHEREKTAMQKICDELPEKGEEVYVLWERYEAGADATAKLAKEIDKYQSIEQALDYEIAQGIPGLFREFRDYLLNVFEHPAVLEKVREQEERATEKGIKF